MKKEKKELKKIDRYPNNVYWETASALGLLMVPFGGYVCAWAGASLAEGKRLPFDVGSMYGIFASHNVPGVEGIAFMGGGVMGLATSWFLLEAGFNLAWEIRETRRINRDIQRRESRY